LKLRVFAISWADVLIGCAVCN